MTNERPVSPINGVPLPVGKPFVRGEEQREKASKAGKRSAEVRRARKTLRDELLDLLEVQITKNDGKKSSTQTAISSAMIKEAMRGNTKAYEIIRDTIGEKPVEKVMIAEVEQSVIDEVEQAVLDDETLCAMVDNGDGSFTKVYKQ